MVGTFYRSSSPGAKPFRRSGQPGQRARPSASSRPAKILNEIEADKSGTVTRILGETARPVEYGQPREALFVIE